MIHHYYHVYQDPEANWVPIAAEHLLEITKSGLGDRLLGWESGMTVGVVGSHPEAAVSLFRGQTLDHVETPEGFEQTTLMRLQEDLQYLDGAYVFYAHTKGAAYGSEWNDSWRRTMEHFTVTHWRNMVAALETHDIACCWWISEAFHPNPHPQGNFWWARADYLKTLPPISTADRWKAELWVGQNNPRVYDAYPGSAGGAPMFGSPEFECPLCR